jgi:hypothetical protein
MVGCVVAKHSSDQQYRQVVKTLYHSRIHETLPDMTELSALVSIKAVKINTNTEIRPSG